MFCCFGRPPKKQPSTQDNSQNIAPVVERVERAEPVRSSFITKEPYAKDEVRCTLDSKVYTTNTNQQINLKIKRPTESKLPKPMPSIEIAYMPESQDNQEF